MKEFKNYCRHGFAYNTYVTGNYKLFPNSKDEMNKKEDDTSSSELIVKYYVSEPSSVQLYTASSEMGVLGSLMFNKIEIDDIEVSIDFIDNATPTRGGSPIPSGTFFFDEAGYHTVKYTLKDPTIIGGIESNLFGAVFAGCVNIVEVVIPNSVIIIGQQTFSNCTNLTNITIPNSVTFIGIGAFVTCTSLTSITIPDSVTSIGDYAFAGCSSLTSVIIGNNVTSIGNYAFNNCISLTNVTIPNTVTSIGSLAFQLCTGLTSIILGNGITTIGEAAFQICTGLTSIVIPNSVISIDSGAFNSCTNLTSITIGSNVTTIGQDAFGNCSKLTSITSLATTPPSIQNTTFQNVKSGGTLYVPQGTTVTGYGNWMSTDDFYLGKYGWNIVEIYDSLTDPRLIAKFNVTSTSSATSLMNSSVTSQFSEIEIDGIVQPSVVSSYTFDTTGEHTVKYTLVDPTTVSYMSFYMNYNIKSVIIPNNITSINASAFGNCAELTDVVLGSGLTNINTAFRDCYNLSSIISLATTAPTIQSDTFQDIKTGGTLTVPSGSTGYDVWMGTDDYYLGKYSWTKIEQ